MPKVAIQNSDLTPEHRVTIFPSLGYFDSVQNCWKAMVHGRVSMNGRVPLGKRLLLKGLQRAMEITAEELASDTFRERIGGFMASPGRKKQIVLEILGEQHTVQKKSRSDGSFWELLNLKQVPLNHLGSWAEKIHLCREESTSRTDALVMGTLHMTASHGISVVSDIDDTIKLTETTSRRKMLANTFLRPFAAVEGMPELYQAWQRAGSDFHYVSRSPWELYGPLSDLCASSGFPDGSMHLRYFRVRDEMFKRVRPVRRSLKVSIIADLLQRLPKRRFVLVGDSGEKDPEIYRFLAERFPDRVAAILIREMNDALMTGRRLRKLQSLPPRIQVTVFRQPEQIKDTIAQLA
jgi:phosphatidate phosphatase APP1